MSTQNEIGQSPKIAFVTQLTEQSTSDLEGAGTTRIDQFGKRYRWVYNSGDVAARVGSPACFDATNIAEAYVLKRIPVEDVAAGDLPLFAGVYAVPAPVPSAWAPRTPRVKAYGAAAPVASVAVPVLCTRMSPMA